MTTETKTVGRASRRRVDAERNISAILDAAVSLLATRPSASMDEIARAAGVTRQTVYAHYSSRPALIRAVAERAVGQAVTALDAARLHKGPPSEALVRALDAGWQTLERYSSLVLNPDAPMSVEEIEQSHAPIQERLERLVRRGQRRGEFTTELPARWLLVAMRALMHAAMAEVANGRMRASQADVVVKRSVLGLFGVAGAER